MTNVTKISQCYLLNFCAIYETQNADNSKMFGIWLDDKLRYSWLTSLILV